MAPPQLNAAPRKAPKVKVQKKISFRSKVRCNRVWRNTQGTIFSSFFQAAGDKKLLLLAQLYPEAEVEEQPEKKSLFADLPAAVTATSIAAARQEVSRQNAVDAYRLLKKQRSQGKKDQTPRSSNNEWKMFFDSKNFHYSSILLLPPRPSVITDAILSAMALVVLSGIIKKRNISRNAVEPPYD